MQVFQSREYAGCEKPRFQFGEFVLFTYVVAQISPWHQIHDEVQILTILESLSHVDDERVPHSRQQLSFVFD